MEGAGVGSARTTSPMESSRAARMARSANVGMRYAFSAKNWNVTCVAYRTRRTTASGMFSQGSDRQQLAGNAYRLARQWRYTKNSDSKSGSWVLARAGLLDGYKATIHWENRASIAEVFPKVILTDNVFEIDRDRFSASGAAAAMDMMLHFIR